MASDCCIPWSISLSLMALDHHLRTTLNHTKWTIWIHESVNYLNHYPLSQLFLPAFCWSSFPYGHSQDFSYWIPRPYPMVTLVAKCVKNDDLNGLRSTNYGHQPISSTMNFDRQPQSTSVASPLTINSTTIKNPCTSSPWPAHLSDWW